MIQSHLGTTSKFRDNFFFVGQRFASYRTEIFEILRGLQVRNAVLSTQLAKRAESRKSQSGGGGSIFRQLKINFVK